MTPPPRRRPHQPGPSPLSLGLQWASAITTIGLEMALPILLGAWIDRRFGTGQVWTILFAIAGFAAAMLHLWDLVKRLGRRRQPQSEATRPPDGEHTP